MQLALAGIFVLALLALFAGPALARGNAVSITQPTIVAAVDAFDKTGIKLDSWAKGGIHIESQGIKLADKWKVSSLKCSDVTVVAMAGDKVVSSAGAMSDPNDPASCVYSMKVPSSIPLSVYAQIGNAQSVGITSLGKGQKEGVPGYDKLGSKSDLVSTKIFPPGGLKGAPQLVKIRDSASSISLPLYIKLDN
jgi:hypothetical protein